MQTKNAASARRKVYLKAFKFKLYSSKSKKHLWKDLFIATNIYNHCISLHKRYYKFTGKYLNKFQLQKHLTKLKKREKYQWNKLNSQVIQDITDRIDKGYKLFFQERAKGNTKIRPPTYKGKRKYRSITFKQTGYKYLGGNRVLIGKKEYKFFQSREIIGIIKTFTVKKDAVGDWWIIFTCNLPGEYPKPEKYVMLSKITGLDLGYMDFLVGDTGNKYQLLPHLKKSLDKRKKCSQSLSRKQKGSNNRKRARKKLAKIYRRLGWVRTQSHFDLAYRLLALYDVIFLETLDLEEHKKRHGKKIQDLAHASFIITLQYLAKKLGKIVHKIDKWEATSKRCSSCLWKYVDLTLDERIWTCQKCGVVHDRDVNAGVNIKRVGIIDLRALGYEFFETREERDERVVGASTNITEVSSTDGKTGTSSAVSAGSRISRL